MSIGNSDITAARSLIDENFNDRVVVFVETIFYNPCIWPLQIAWLISSSQNYTYDVFFYYKF